MAVLKEGSKINNKEIATKDDLEKVKEEFENKINKTGGEFTGITKAYNNNSYSVAQIRNVIISPNDADVNLMKDGDIWIKYGEDVI